MHPLRFVALAATLIGAVPLTTHAQQSPSVPAYRSFRDWVIGCDNTRNCTALGLPQADGEGDAFLRVQRAAGATAPPLVTLAVYDETPGRTTLSLNIDNAPIAALPPQIPVSNDNEDDGFIDYLTARLTPLQALAFLDAARNGTTLTIASSMENHVNVSLAGSAAALLFMDDVQGRVASETALIRRGNRPASIVPAAVAPPLVKPAPLKPETSIPTALEQAVRRYFEINHPGDCDPADNPQTDAVYIDPLAGGDILVSVLCTMGAYNENRSFFTVDPARPDQPRPVDFPTPEPRSADAPAINNTLTNGEFNPESGMLGFFSKGRGIGDCGSSGMYAWTGSTFELVEYRAMHECRGVPEAFWPTLWQAKLP